jgi:hypothetical protein
MYPFFPCRYVFFEIICHAVLQFDHSRRATPRRRLHVQFKFAKRVRLLAPVNCIRGIFLQAQGDYFSQLQIFFHVVPIVPRRAIF